MPSPSGSVRYTGLAHQMIRHAGVLTDLGEMPDESAEGGAIRQQNGEMVEAESAAAWNRHGAAPLVQLDQRRGVGSPVRASPEPASRSRTRRPEDPLVPGERAGQVGDLEADETDAGRRGRRYPGGATP